MSSIVTSQGIVHYEAYGRGRPVILLHGWINSWNVWRGSIIYLAEKAGFKVYALDFWGFGESANDAEQPFRLVSFVDMVDQFMESLGILKAPVIGHSMGGTVALRLALEKPQRVTRVAVIGAPIEGTSLNFFLKLAGVDWIARMIKRSPVLLWAVIRLNTIGDSKYVREMIMKDAQNTTTESFFRSIGDLHHTDLRESLKRLKIPTMGIYGKGDNIVSPSQAKVLASSVNGALIHMMSRSRHFVMLDEPDEFHKFVGEFLES